jgi:tryptophanyl-tRNA synthetase
MRIDPWASRQDMSYEEMMHEFGLESFSIEKFPLPDPIPVYRRGVVFSHRGFDVIHRAVQEKRPFKILTGLMPTGSMHLGHKMVIDEVVYFQSLGADVSIAVADLEAWGARGLDLETAREKAVSEYIINYIALGLKPERCRIYFQSEEKAVTDLAYASGRKVNLSTMRAIYGFGDATNMAHFLAPLIQVGDILHVQLPELGGAAPTLVPVGVDQDPHIRLTRDIASSFRTFSVKKAKDGRIGVFLKGEFPQATVEKYLGKARGRLQKLGYADFKMIPKYQALYILGAVGSDIPELEEELLSLDLEFGGYGFYTPSSSYHRFVSGLGTQKMSSSVPESAIFLNDEPKVGKKKIMRAKTGGRVSLEEQRKLGGDPGNCTVFEMNLIHFMPDDRELEDIETRCRSGELLCGECKKICAEKVACFLEELARRREEAKERINEYICSGQES